MPDGALGGVGTGAGRVAGGADAVTRVRLGVAPLGAGKVVTLGSGVVELVVEVVGRVPGGVEALEAGRDVRVAVGSGAGAQAVTPSATATRTP